MWKILLRSILGLAVVAVSALIYGAMRWQSATDTMHATLEAARLPVGPKAYSTNELVGLPAPVQRYFRAALTDGQPIILAVSVEHTGTFNMAATGNDQWRPFSSTQRVITQRPGFDWEARIAMLPGLPVRVHDAYIAGEGMLHASLFGLVSVANLRGTPEMAQGELLRWFAETAWYPTALLPSQGVHWLAVDFNADDMIASMRAEARGAQIDGVMVPPPWEGRWSSYELRDGMRIPIEGEVAWLFPAERRPYWRGGITSIVYEFAQ
jgi:uncharacterized protein DUF6920